ncbi:hypothetical protein Ahu01nite_056510 [Winogradskya humida]|uniref:Uncharacterized protein n=1 Tax=Winogradskya humida TaxID=113566 RepID=A0ABQ3ZVD6_9ACTN|nr:hypothetical protein Ahu01nite_056510 [Actinoplanes humidus]
MNDEAGTETVRIDIGDKTVRIELPDETTRIELPDETPRIVLPDETVRMDVGDRTVRMPAPNTAGAHRTDNSDTQVIRPPIPPQSRRTRRAPAGPARPDGTSAGADKAAGGPPIHTVVLPRISDDPLEELVDRMRPKLARAVDALQVAAALESDGFTDRGAKVEYGFADVFALAVEVYRRLGPPLEQPAAADTPRTWRAGLRVLAHGPLYALPSAVFPAVLGVLGQRSVVLALTLASALGWLYAGTAAFAAYKLLGGNRPRAAARLLRFATVGAPFAGAACGFLVVAVTGGGWGLVVLAMCQLGYQLAGTVLVFYRREGVQALTMVPAVVFGCAYLLAGPALRTPALVTAAAGVTAAYVAALLLTRNRGDVAEASGLPLLRLQLPGLAGVTWYGLCSAALLLHAEAPYLLNRLDIAAAVAPLILAMGFVEWRAEGFRAAAVRITRLSHRPEDFQRAMRVLIARETLLCLAVPAGLGLVLVAGLALTGWLSAPGVVMIAAHVVLGGAYYSAFLLAGFERFGWLCWSMLAALAVHIGIGAALGAAPLLGRTAHPLTDTLLYLGSVVALQGLFLYGLSPFAGQVRHFR